MFLFNEHIDFPLEYILHENKEGFFPLFWSSRTVPGMDLQLST